MQFHPTFRPRRPNLPNCLPPNHLFRAIGLFLELHRLGHEQNFYDHKLNFFICIHLFLKIFL